MQDERQRLHHASKREFEVITNMQRKPRIQNFGWKNDALTTEH